MSKIFEYAIFTLFFIGVVGTAIWSYNLYEQVQYEANHPILPKQNSSDVVYQEDQYTFALDSKKYDHNPRIYYFANNDNLPIVKITGNNYTDWSNATISINISYIKQIRQENNTMIISIRKD